MIVNSVSVARTSPDTVTVTFDAATPDGEEPETATCQVKYCKGWSLARYINAALFDTGHIVAWAHQDGGHDCGDTTDFAGNCAVVVDGDYGQWASKPCDCECHEPHGPNPHSWNI